MAAPSYTYTLTNGTTADASQVTQNFTDILNGVSDGTKDLTISALTVGGTATLNGNVTLGNATGDDLTFTGSVASAVVPKTDATYALGSSSIGWSGIYLGRNANRVRLIPHASASESWDCVLPAASTGTSTWVLNSSGALSFGHTTTTGKTIDGSADEVQLTVQGNATQTSDILLVEKSDGTDLLNVTNTAGTKIRGTTSNDSASAGFVGEILTASGTNTSSPSDASYDQLAQLTLTAGDWDVDGTVVLTAGSISGLTQRAAALSSSSSSPDTATQGGVSQDVTADGSFARFWQTGTRRFSVSTATTHYLLGWVNFTTTGSALWSASSYIRARRVR